MDLDLSAEVKEINNSEVGEDLILQTTSPAEIKTIRGVFHQQYSQDESFDGAEEAYEYWVECGAADVINARQNDSITRLGVVYNIETRELMQSAFTILRLTVNP